LKDGRSLARWGNCDFNQLKKMQKKMENLQKVDLDLFCKECSKELAARLLGKIIKKTPIGQYPSSTGKVGGTLVKGWTADKNMNAKSYVSSLPISKTGSDYIIEIINPVKYSSYVEFGHRTANHKRWIKGTFMMTISEMELESQAEKIIEKKLIKFLGEYLNGQ
jgi:hypothetical protein